MKTFLLAIVFLACLNGIHAKIPEVSGDGVGTGGGAYIECYIRKDVVVRFLPSFGEYGFDGAETSKGETELLLLNLDPIQRFGLDQSFEEFTQFGENVGLPVDLYYYDVRCLDSTPPVERYVDVITVVPLRSR